MSFSSPMLPGLLSMALTTPPALLFLFRPPFAAPPLRMLTGLFGLNEAAPPGPTSAGLSMYGKRGKGDVEWYIGKIAGLPAHSYFLRQQHGCAGLASFDGCCGCWWSGLAVPLLVS